MCVSAVSGVSLVGVSLLSADVAVAVVRPEVIYQRVLISKGRTRAHRKVLVKAHTIVQPPGNRKFCVNTQAGLSCRVRVTHIGAWALIKRPFPTIFGHLTHS
jgi:hypothetical protein